jgi:phosphoglycerol transferase
MDRRKEARMEAASAPAHLHRVRRAVLLYLGTAVLAVAMAYGILQLWEVKLSVPLNYYHDIFPVLMWIKSVTDTGWWVNNEFLGTPGRLSMYDYPTNPNLHMAAIRVLALFSSNPALLLNVYFLLCFGFVAMAALRALREMDISAPFAVAGSLLYTFLPYHFWRGEAHLFLSSYYMVPLVVLVILWVWKGDPFLVVRRANCRLALDLTSTRAVASLLICAAVGFDSTYYPIFGGFLMTVCGMYAYYAKRSRAALGRAILLTTIIAGSLTLNVGPTLLYQHKHGPNPSALHASRRSWQDTELNSLRIIQMILPAANHPIRYLRQVHDQYYLSTPIASETDSMALGAVASVGFVFLLVRLFTPRRTNSQRTGLYGLLSMLTLAAVLLGTSGGAATLFSLLALSMARCFNRLSIFIALFALGAVFSILDAWRQRFALRGWRACVAHGGLACIVLLGILDQTGQNYRVPFLPLYEEFRSDRTFVRDIEKAVPPGTRIFQFPFVSFLSLANDSYHLGPYSHFRGYLHSHALKWSFGAMHGRPIDLLHARVVQRPMPECIRQLAWLGFGGIYVDRHGYPDNGRLLESQLADLLQTKPIVSANGRLAFYDMGPYVQKLRSACSETEWAGQRNRLLSQPLVAWKEGFFLEEREQHRPEHYWRWCGRTGELEILNPTDATHNVVISFLGVTFHPEESEIIMLRDGVVDRMVVDSKGREHRWRFEITPGRHLVQFYCTGRSVDLPGRTVIFALHNFACDLVGP